MVILYWAARISFPSLCLRNTVKVGKCVCMSPTVEREQRVSRLVPQRTPPAAAILEVVVSPWHGMFLSVGVLSASESNHFPSLLFFNLIVFPNFIASLLPSLANALLCKCEIKVEEEGEKRRDEPPVEEGAPLHAPPLPLTPLSLSSPAHLNKLTPLDI